MYMIVQIYWEAYWRVLIALLPSREGPNISFACKVWEQPLWDQKRFNKKVKGGAGDLSVFGLFERKMGGGRMEQLCMRDAIILWMDHANSTLMKEAQNQVMWILTATASGARYMGLPAKSQFSSPGRRKQEQPKSMARRLLFSSLPSWFLT